MIEIVVMLVVEHARARPILCISMQPPKERCALRLRVLNTGRSWAQMHLFLIPTKELEEICTVIIEVSSLFAQRRKQPRAFRQEPAQAPESLAVAFAERRLRTHSAGAQTETFQGQLSRWRRMGGNRGLLPSASDPLSLHKPRYALGTGRPPTLRLRCRCRQVRVAATHVRCSSGLLAIAILRHMGDLINCHLYTSS